MKKSILQNFPAILTVTILVGLGGAVVWDQTTPKSGTATEVMTASDQAAKAQPSDTAVTESEPKKSTTAKPAIVAETASAPEKTAKPKAANETKLAVAPVAPKVPTVASGYPTLQGNTNALAQALEPINESQGAINFGCFIIGESCPADKPNCGIEELMSTPSFFPFMNVGIAMMRTMGNAMVNQTAMGIPITGALNVMFKMTPRVKVPPPYVYKYQPKPWPWTQPKS